MDSSTQDTARDISALARDEEFLALRRRKNRVALLLTLAMFAVYYGFIALMAYGKDFLGTKISGATTVGIPIGIGVICRRGFSPAFTLRGPTKPTTPKSRDSKRATI